MTLADYFEPTRGTRNAAAGGPNVQGQLQGNRQRRGHRLEEIGGPATQLSHSSSSCHSPLTLKGGSPFDTGFTALQTLFTGTVAKVASLIAIVIGGYQFAHGEPGAKKALAGVAAGTGIAVLAVNVLTWLWGV